jgi:glycosyltransferase involved in cell wall biosynthesis
MNDKPTVSIGLPVHNGAAFLAEAIESILAQTFADFELVISDNASTDRTPEICRSYAAADGRIRYYRQETTSAPRRTTMWCSSARAVNISSGRA